MFSVVNNKFRAFAKQQKTIATSPNNKTQDKQKVVKKEDSSFTQKNTSDTNQYKMKRIENSNAYLPDLDSDSNGNLSKKKAVLDKEINKIFNEKLPDIRNSILNKRNSDDSFLSVKSNDKQKTDDSGRIKAHSQISMNKNVQKGSQKKAQLNDSSCYGSSKKYKYKSGNYNGPKAGQKKFSQKKDTSLPPPIKNRELENSGVPSNSLKGRNVNRNMNIGTQGLHELCKSSIMSEQEMLNYMFSSRKNNSIISKPNTD